MTHLFIFGWIFLSRLLQFKFFSLSHSIFLVGLIFQECQNNVSSVWSMCLFSGWARLILADAFTSQTSDAGTALMSRMLVRANVVSERKRGGAFFLHRALGVQWHQSLSSSVEFTAGMHESDQPLMRGQWKRLPKTTWKHTSSLQTWFSSEMTYFITFPGGSGPKKASISPLVSTGDDGMSRKRPRSFTASFPVGLTPSRTDVFSAPNLFSLKRVHGYRPLSRSSSASNFPFAWFVSNCCSVLLCSVSVSSLAFSVIPLFLYFFSIAHCLCEALSWPNAWLRPRWLKVAQGMARLMFSLSFTSFVLFISFAASPWPFFLIWTGVFDKCGFWSRSKPNFSK